nr:mandelate racemase/muconate lactonizing enzyme family protein [Ilumatobacter coccineus]
MSPTIEIGLTISPGVSSGSPATQGGTVIRIHAITALPVTFGTDRERMSFLFVRVEGDNGLVGYGEACDSYGCSYASVLATVIDDVLAPLLIGEELEAVGPLADRMRLFTRRRLGDQWVGPQARSALEIAMWDLLAKSNGRSVSSQIGRVRDSIEVYASSGFLEEGPAAFHAEKLRPFLEAGVRMVKVRTGPEWRDDIATMTELKALLGDGIEMMVDGSETYTLSTALELAHALADLDVRWLEEPLPQGAHAGIEELVRRSPVAIAYGEHLFGNDEAIESMRRGRLNILQPDASTAGGLSAARDMAASAASFGVRVVPHVCAGPISLAANLHLAATVSAIRAIEFPPTLLPVWKTFGTGADLGLSAITDGHLAIPDGPGLGVDLDEAAVAAHPYEAPGARAAGTTGGLPDRFVGDR